MRLILIPALTTMVMLTACATSSAPVGAKKEEKKLTQTLQAVYTCKGNRHLGVAYEFVNDTATKAIVSSKGQTYELKRADQADEGTTAFTDGRVVWLASGEVTQQSINTHQGSRLLRTSGNRKAAVIAQGCNAS